MSRLHLKQTNARNIENININNPKVCANKKCGSKVMYINTYFMFYKYDNITCVLILPEA